MGKKKDKFGYNATWSMAVGGMVGGGIFSVLGVVVGTAGQWAWLSFVIAGIIALISAHSYGQLSVKYEKSGGSFTFLNQEHMRGTAASLSWILVLGYVLTISVYAFTFGHYVAHVVHGGAWVPRVLAFCVIAALAWVNMRGVGDASRVEIITVWGKVFVLLGLAVFGLAQWDAEELTAGIEPGAWTGAIVGAATIFMAYEGFQLLSYDYEEIDQPKKTLPRATIAAVLSVIVIYILVTLGATMLVGAGTLIEKKEVALAIAGQKALGTAGLIIVTIAAVFSTGSAINATLFSTARLMRTVAKEHDLPQIVGKENDAEVPYVAVLIIAGVAAALAALGSLSTLVDAASLIFLVTFGVVNAIAFHEKVKYRWACLLGAIACGAAIVTSSMQQFQHRPIPLFVIVGLMVLAVVIRPLVLRRMQ